MKIPGPDHPITIAPAATRWRVGFQGHVIADTGDALILEEENCHPVVYFPRGDVSLEFLTLTDRATYCPYKGDASYYTLLMDGHFAENAVWTYEEPFPAMEQIRGRLAFYREKVEVYAVEDEAVVPHALRTDIDEAILHTDSGSGSSQREHWPTNLDDPTRPHGG
ncbi:MAG TPA: DUF427 domain-containing protein [Phenylobacterium sp.]|nr:DUF427 domain-containing protein [Phenylobacterium sp.]